MKEQYSKVCSNLIEFYNKYLTDKEILALRKILKIDNYDNLNIIIFINKLIDRVWQMTLTKPNQFVNGKPFTFLVTRDLLPNEFNLSGFDYFKKHSNHFLELIDEKNIIKSVDGINGIIVEIDYLNTFSYPLLPIDFKDKERILAKAKLDLKGIYNISLGLHNYDGYVESSTYFAKEVQLPKIDIAKPLYNYLQNNIILDKIDVNSLANTLIVYYLLENNYNNEIIKVRDQLKKSYKKIIATKYSEYFKRQISLDEFVAEVFKLLENDILLTNIDKLM